MQVKINGKAEEFPGGTYPRSAHRPRRLNRKWLQSRSMTVCWNASHLGTTHLNDGDRVEFLFYMGGGR